MNKKGLLLSVFLQSAAWYSYRESSIRKHLILSRKFASDSMALKNSGYFIGASELRMAPPGQITPPDFWFVKFSLLKQPHRLRKQTRQGLKPMV
ncbi:MAG: hypothetical protein HC811_09375 [Flammeovirgaceae bacterium]|nr:hypothetical protein [Flammeovirgaceae bacterium]